MTDKDKLAAMGDKNPLKADAELSMLLKKLTKIGKYKTFQRWKTKFLERLEQFLYEAGIVPADEAGVHFDKMLTKFLKMADKVTDHIHKGELSRERKTVKSSLALNEMCKQLNEVVETLSTLIPGSAKEEKARGYTKFHLGAALIRQGFHQYLSMTASQDAIELFKEKLEGVADRQVFDLFEYFNTWVERFCAVMADLGLYDVVMKCLEFAEAPEEEESSDEEDIHIEIEVATPEGLKRLKLEIDPRETIGNIKDAISGDIGIEPEKQVMKFKGNELADNGASLKKCGIVNGSKLTVEPFRIPITVKTSEGLSIPLLIEPTAYVSQIKEMVEKQTGVPAANQTLFYNDQELDSDLNKACDYGIEANAVLDMEPKTIRVNVELPDGKQMELDLSPHDTDDDIKAKIEQKTGMTTPRQVLKTNGEQIPHGVNVKDLGMKDGSHIKVEVFKVPVTVNTHDGKSFETMVDPTMFISDLKRQLEPDSGVPAKNQKLSLKGTELDEDMKKAQEYGIEGGSVLDLEPKLIKVQVEMPMTPGKRWARTTENEVVEVEISPSATTEDLKQKIQEKTTMPVPTQVLKFDGQDMPDSKTLKAIGVQDGSTVQVELHKVPVTVNTYDGKRIETMVDPTMFMSDFKRELEEEVGLPAANQKIFKDGVELDDDTKKVQNYGIKGGDELFLEPKKMTVTVGMPNGSKVEVDITPHDTSADIKKKIEDKTGMAAPRQVLKKQGMELPDGKAAKDMGIGDGDSLSVDVCTVPVTVRTMDGKVIKIDVDPTDKLGDIKKRLESESGIPWDNQNLLKDGHELSNDNLTAGAHGITAGDVLDLELKSMNLQVEMPDGSSCEIAVSPADTSDDIKRKIFDQTGMAVPRQVVSHGGKQLPNGVPTRQMALEDGSKLKVDVFKIPVTVNTMDGEKHRVLIDPTDTLGNIKDQLANDIGLPSDNQRLYMDGRELDDDRKTAQDYGIKAGSQLDSEPKQIRVVVHLPDGSVVSMFVKPSDRVADIKNQVEDTTGLAVKRQLLKGKLESKDWLLPINSTVRDLGLRDGADLFVEIHKIPIVVQTMDGETKYDLEIEPSAPIDVIRHMLQKMTGVDATKIKLYFHEEEMADPAQAAEDYGVKAHSLLTMDTQMDAIVFVDIKCGTLFAMDREEVIQKQALTAYQGNKLDFSECARDGPTRDKILTALKGSPTLGFAPQVVVEKMDIEDYEIEEAENVKSLWGVSLKKREKNKKGEEFIFIDPKTGACGELSRKKYLDMGFITPITTSKGQTLKEAETDTMSYDRYIHEIRAVFGVKSAN